MTDSGAKRTIIAMPSVERIKGSLLTGDLYDLCDATIAAIEAGGGFGWVKTPTRESLERYWQGVTAMNARILIVARLDGVIAGSVQMIKPPLNNEAQSFAVHLTGVFIAPWARGHKLARMLMQKAEETALEEGFGVINLDVRDTQEAAIKLYEDLGYTQFGAHPIYARIADRIVSGRYYYKAIDSKRVS